MDLRARLREWLLDDFGSAPLHVETEGGPVCEAEIRAKSAGVLAGRPYLLPLFEEAQRLLALDRGAPPEIRWEAEEGAAFAPGDLLARVRGHGQILMKAERTALNLLSYVSEIATHTRGVLEAFGEFPPGFRGILDTRKGRPGLMFFEKCGVRVGGGKNHRLGMFDGELIKDNDIAVAGSIPAAVDARWDRRYMVEIQIEVQSLAQLGEVIEDGRVHMILLDNMDAAALREAVGLARARGAASRTGKPYVLEASGIKGGGLPPGAGLREIAETGVDYISSSALVRSAPPLDFNMKIVKVLR
ncbi:MAG: nicotinate-nucleotide diphosphorylase (carboxylating) [bacterium]